MFKALLLQYFYLITWNSMHHVLHHVVNRVLSPVSSCTKYRVSCNITLTGGVTCCIMDHVDRAVSIFVSCPITCCNISVQFAPLPSRYKVYRGWYKHSDCMLCIIVLSWGCACHVLNSPRVWKTELVNSLLVLFSFLASCILFSHTILCFMVHVISTWISRKSYHFYKTAHLTMYSLS